jgi:hypothetical protein
MSEYVLPFERFLYVNKTLSDIGCALTCSMVMYATGAAVVTIDEDQQGKYR